MNGAMEDGKGQRQQRWCLTTAAAGGHGGQRCLRVVMDNGEGSSGDR
jgi:hypothetical protein